MYLFKNRIAVYLQVHEKRKRKINTFAGLLAFYFSATKGSMLGHWRF